MPSQSKPKARPGLNAMNSVMNLSKRGPSFAVQLLARGKKNQKNLDSRRGSLVMQMDKINLNKGEEEKKTEDEPPADPAAEKIMGKRRMSALEVKNLGIEDEESALFEEVMGISVAGTKSLIQARRRTEDLSDSDDEASKDVTDAERLADADPYNVPFAAKFKPDEMRCLALVAHNHMKPAMKDFVASHKEILKKFRLTGTNTTMTMLKNAFGDDPDVMYGPTCQSGPLGGDAEICALMCLEDLGGMIFFVDPLSAHPHQADIDSLVRLANVHNIISASNPASAHALCFVLKCSLEQGRKDKIPSFFYSLQSPGVKVYKAEQKRQVEQNK